MKKLSRSLSILLVFVLLLAVFSACGKTGGEVTPSDTDTSVPTDTATSTDTAPDTDAVVSYGEYTAENPLVLKLTVHGSDDKANVPNMAAYRLAEALEEATGGAIMLDLYTASVLTANDSQTIEAVIGGAVEMGIPNTPILGTYVDSFGVLDLCYLFKSNEEAAAFVASDVADQLCATVEDNDVGAKILSLIYFGAKNVGADRPINSMSDMNGLVIRVNDGEYNIKAFEAFGAAPQTMGGAEVLSALSQGIFDAMEHTNAIISTGYDEYLRYISVTEHIQMFCSFAINEDVWNSLDPAVQAVLQETCDAVAVEMSDWALQLDGDSRDVLEERGVTFIDLDKQEWMDAVTGVYDDYFAAYGSEWFDAIRALY